LKAWAKARPSPSFDRNQVAEEEFIVSVVAYNTSIAQLQRAQGVMLKVQDVVPLQTKSTSPIPPQPTKAGK
jgi:hypothetical protein